MLPRLKMVWYHIILPLCTWMYLSAYLANKPLLASFGFIGLLFASVLFTAISGYLLNDFFDRAKDEASRKFNFFNAFPSWSFPVAIFVAIVTVLIWLVLQPPAAVWWLLCLQGLLLLIYSIPGIRLKQHNVGLVADALYSRVIPATVLLLLGLGGFSRLSIYFWLTLWGWLLIAGLRNIILHQIDDRKKDKASDSKNWVSKHGPLKATRIVRRVLLPLEMILLMAWAAITWPLVPWLVVLCIGGLAFTAISYVVWERPPYNLRWLSIKSLYLPNHLYEEWLPLYMLVFLGLANRWFVVLIFFHVILFGMVWYKYMPDLRPLLSLIGMTYRYIFSKVRLVLSRMVNHTIYQGFRLFNVDLKKGNTSAFEYLRKKCK